MQRGDIDLAAGTIRIERQVVEVAKRAAGGNRDPSDLDAVHGLQDVYYKWGKWEQALDWSKKAAALRPDDEEQR